jgi:hypothetical protein
MKKLLHAFLHRLYWKSRGFALAQKAHRGSNNEYTRYELSRDLFYKLIEEYERVTGCKCALPNTWNTNNARVLEYYMGWLDHYQEKARGKRRYTHFYE